MSAQKTRTIEVEILTRVEGEGALRVDVEGNKVVSVHLAIYEPPRFFEALLRGRQLEDVPDITARICGICPVAYQMTSVHALESALGVEITPEIRSLRKLLYCGEWIESHGVHMVLLNIPDFFDCPNCIELAKRFPDQVNRGLQLKKIGNQLLELLGGRAVNPINVAVGGFYKAPNKADLRAMLDDLKWSLEAAIELTRWVAAFPYPEFELDCEMVSLRHGTEYPMNEGRVVSTLGLDIEAANFEKHFREHQVPHSTALQATRIPEGTSYWVGPLARLNLNRELLSPLARQLSDSVGTLWPCFNPYKSLIARALEVVHSFEQAIVIVEEYEGCTPARIPYEYRECEGYWATEAPRGTIYHRYRVTEDGKISFANIVPPTSQNQRQIELSLMKFLPTVLDQDDATIGIACEKLIRTFDPCISCSTHFLKTVVHRK